MHSVAKSCLSLCNPMDCSPPGSSGHGISEARIQEWVAISSSRDSSPPKGWNLCLLCLLHCRQILDLLSHLCSVSSVAHSGPTLCEPMDCTTPGFPVHHQLLEHAQTHVHGVGDDIQPSHPLSSPSTSAFNLSQHQSLFQWVSSSHQVAKVLEFQLQYQSF